MINNSDSIVRETIGRWQEQLLQLDGRNRLLYWRELRGSSVPIIADDPDAFFKRLESAKGGLSFPLAVAAPRTRSLFDGEKALEEPPTVYPGDIETRLEADRLQVRLANLRRKDREFTEEQGVNVLFLAVGFLLWEDETGEIAQAPLVLVPCDLERASPRDHYYLRKEDDDLTVNATLIYKLGKLGVTLPEFDVEETIGSYLRAVENSVQGHRWTVEKNLVLDTFQYSKAAMWEDLEGLKNSDVDHPLVRGLAGDPDAGQGKHSNEPGWFNLTRPDELAGAKLDDLAPDPRALPVVVDADFSQLQAIGAAAAGLNLLIHGPPGTGKSQTIANLIATLIASGKTVLFVSEKTAALDVVKRRLDQCNLGVFCLDMHSERGKKANVYRQLRESLDDKRHASASAFDYDALLARRDELNRVARALHARRNPLGRSVFQIHGRLATLNGLPDVQFNVHSPGSMDAPSLNRVVLLAKRLAPYAREFAEHDTSSWLPLRTSISPVGLSDAVIRDARAIERAVISLRQVAQECARWLGTRSPTSARGIEHLDTLVDLLSRAPGLPDTWLNRTNKERLRQIAGRQAESQSRRADLQKRLAGHLRSPGAFLSAAEVARCIDDASRHAPAVAVLLGTEGWTVPAILSAGALAEAAEALPSSALLAESALAQLASSLGLPAPADRLAAAPVFELATAIRDLAPVPGPWLAEDAASWQIPQAIDAARETLAELRALEARLLQTWDEALMGTVSREMLARYRTDHQRWSSRVFGSAFRSDQRSLRTCMKSVGPLPLSAAEAAVADALRLIELRENSAGQMQALVAALGGRFRGRDTPWAEVLAELELTSDLLKRPSGKRFADLLADEPSALGSLADDAARALERLFLLESVLRPSSTGLGIPAELVPYAASALPGLRAMATAISTLAPEILVPMEALPWLKVLLDDELLLQSYEQEMATAAAALAADFGPRFDGWDTDWPAILAALSWADEFVASAGPSISDRLAQHAVSPDEPVVYENWESRLAEEISDFNTETNSTKDRFDESMTPWGSWREAAFDELVGWAQEVSTNAGQGADWLRYSGAVRELEAETGKGSVSLIRALTSNPADVTGIVERRLLQAWLQSIYETEPLLRAFAATDHRLLIEQFKSLDQQLFVAARNEVRRRSFDRYPARIVTYTNAGELQVLRDQLSRQRRQLPVRRLLQRIPGLLLKLKPCLMMSPLAVSQHLARSPLESDSLMFDVVIFDEASQIFPEDAAPAISRGRQVIVVGDEKQLPPTAFFRKLGEDDGAAGEADEDEPNALADRDSILNALDARLGRDFSERYLSVHYRSQHEDLIRFSNHYYYDGRLMVFPSPERKSPDLGIRDIFVPDGRYDAGASRTNETEARRAVDTVLNLMRTRPSDESIGVVALSRAQSDLIERLFDDYRRGVDDLDGRFAGDSAEPFFVKNLENVQGDERDHIVLSIGYGPTTAGGAVANRFGPLNSDLGWRRLNVAVSRARMSMTVVRSLQPSQITSTTRGAQALRRYLEFAQDPANAIAATQAFDPDAEPETPFEEAVLAALRARGHRVQPQVGVEGYRIDLAIYSIDGARFDLGIDCDGKTYHSAPAARDRDWLRQTVLEGLGWSIHRVWSTSWIQNPAAEIALIEAALGEARAKPSLMGAGPSHPGGLSPQLEGGEDGDDPWDEPQTTSGAPGIGRSPFLDHLFDDYAEANLSRLPIGPELRFETDRTLSPLIQAVVEAEGPVHFDLIVERLRFKYGLGRVRAEARATIRSTLNKLVYSGGVIETPEDFYVLPEHPVAPRRPRGSSDPRRIGHISSIEVQAGLVAVLNMLISVPRSELVDETARQFGFDRTGKDIRVALENGIEDLLKDGRIVAGADDTLRPTSPE